MKEIRVRLEGENARLGLVPAADVARMLLYIERAAAQAAAVVLHQPKTTTGRYKGAIEQAVHFRLVAIEEGSVVPVLELPDPAPPELGTAKLDFDVVTLGESAVKALLDAVRQPTDPLIAKAVLDVADGMLVGERYEAIVIEAPSAGRRRRVKIDAKARKRLRRYVDTAPTPVPRTDDLLGSLVEADFEKRTARLRTPTEAAVEVTFSDEHADDVQDALRQRATVSGEVVYDPKTQTAKSVRLKQIVRGEQLVLGVDPSAFWSHQTFADLVQRQGAGQPIDPDDLYNDGATDDEKRAFMAALAELG